jgi:hypothetical protein
MVNLATELARREAGSYRARRSVRAARGSRERWTSIELTLALIGSCTAASAPRICTVHPTADACTLSSGGGARSSSSSGGGGGGGSRAGADNHEERPNCLELGSGTGALGLTVGASGIVRSVVLTDMAAVLPLTRENMRGNRAVLADGGVLCGVAPLLWSTDSVRARQSSVAGTVSRFSTAVRSLLAGLKRSCLACCFAGGGEGTAGQLGGWPPL